MSRQPTNKIVLSSASRGAGSSVSNFVNLRSYEYAMIGTYITAKSGSPTLDIALQMSPVDPSIDNTQWFTVYEEMQIKSTDLTGGGPWHFLGNPQAGWIGWLRVSYLIGGTSTPTLTFSVNIFSK